MRLAGVTNMKIDSFDYITGWGSVIEKGDKERNVFLNANCLKAISDYSIVRNPVAGENKALWVYESGRAMSDTGIQIIFKGLDEQFPGHRIHAHLFRHLWAKFMAINDVGILSMKQMGGWEDIKLVESYASAYTEKQAWNKSTNKSPLETLKHKAEAGPEEKLAAAAELLGISVEKLKGVLK
jgi:integrase/recombinase XerD